MKLRHEFYVTSVPARVILLLALGFVVRMFVAQVFLGGLDRVYDGDEGDYARLANSIAHGNGLVDKNGLPTAIWSPGLPAILSLPIAVFGLNMFSIRVFMCFIESLLVPAAYLLGRTTTANELSSLVIASVAVVFPTWIIPSGALLTDVTGAILVCLTAYTLIEGYRRQSLGWIAVSGVALALATFVRAESPIYLPVMVLWLFIVAESWRKRAMTALALSLSFLCVLAPWSIRSSRIYGTFVLTSILGGEELYKSNNPAATGILAFDHQYFSEVLQKRFPQDQYPNEGFRSKKLQVEAIRFISENPRRFAELCWIRFLEFWKVYSPRVPFIQSFAMMMSFGIALPFFLLQAARTGWQRGPELLLLLLILAHTAAHMVFTSIVRYRIPIEPLVVILAIEGGFWTWRQFRSVYVNNGGVAKASPSYLPPSS